MSDRPSGPIPDASLERLGRGREFRLWETLGAHPEVREGVAGARFAVWAPHAAEVEVVGDFNGWEPGESPLAPRRESGVWEGFVPGARRGAVYKYLLRTRLGGRRVLKADPVAFAAELRPRTGSVVEGIAPFRWRDARWMRGRGGRQGYDRPMSVYEVHLGSWRRESSYRDLAAGLVPYAKEQGFTHLELLPVSEHPFDGSWGYQTTGYFAPTARFGTPADFRAFVDAAHRAGLGVILDWVPAHFPRDPHGLGFFDGKPLYEHADPRRGWHPEWKTYIFDYGKPEVVSFLVSSALFWLEEFHVDGLRVDAVASMLYLDYAREGREWVPNVRGGRENLEAVELIRTLNAAAHERFPDALMIAEESTAWPGVTAPVEKGGLGFDLKWNMGWMNDSLEYFRFDPLYRGKHQGKLTFSLHYAFSERFVLPLSHDEVVHGKASLISKMPGPREQRFANVRALLGWAAAHPGKQLLFMGAELGQWQEWNHDGELEWDLLEHEPHRQLQRWVRDLNRFYVERRELWEVDGSWEGFEWLDCSDEARSVLAFVRRGRAKGRFLVVAANFTPVAWKESRIGVPKASAYRPLLNSDAPEYGGSATAVPEVLATEPVPAHDRPCSVVLTLPPLSVLFLEPVRAARRKPAAKDGAKTVKRSVTGRKAAR